MSSYFSQKTGDFLWELALNNERPWFQAHKAEFETVVHRPLKTFAFETLEIMRERYSLCAIMPPFLSITIP